MTAPMEQQFSGTRDGKCDLVPVIGEPPMSHASAVTVEPAHYASLLRAAGTSASPYGEIAREDVRCCPLPSVTWGENTFQGDAVCEPQVW